MSKSYEDSFGFTHLVEDSDSEDNALDLSHSHLDVDLQPHLSSLETATSITGDVSYADSSGGQSSRTDHSSYGLSSSSTEQTVPSTNTTLEQTVLTTQTHTRENLPEHSSSVRAGNSESTNGQASILHMESSAPAADGSASPVSTVAAVTQPHVVQVQYSNAKGQVEVTQQRVATRPDGTFYINTHGVPVEFRERERPLTKKRILYTKIFAVLSCVLFFPVGMFSVYYAFSIEKEFNEGIIRGNIDKAVKYAKRSERLTMLAMIMSIVVVTLIVALGEKPKHTEHHDRTVILG